VGGSGGVAFDNVVGVVDGEATAGFEEGNKKSRSFGDPEGVAEDVCFEREVAAEGGVGTGDDDDVIREFLENLAEILVEFGGFLAVRARELVRRKRTGGASSMASRMESASRRVRTGTSKTVWVPVGSSSRTTMVRSDDSRASRMDGRRSSAGMGGRLARRS